MPKALLSGGFINSFASDFGSCTRSVISRYTGCLTCKKRHKKCDEKRPRCQNCKRLNLVCEEPELFRPSRLSRSQTGRSPHDDLETSREYNFLPKSYSNEDLGSPIGSGGNGVVVTPSTSYEKSCFNMNSLIKTRSSPAINSLPMENYILQHYIERLSSVLININEPKNVLRHISLPRMFASPMLTNALYATSARHISIYEGKYEYQAASIKYYNKASSALRHSINDLGPDTPVRQREMMLLTSVFLCKYEIISGELKNWRLLLQGLMKMFNICKSIEPSIPEEVISYIKSFIAYHWYIAGITRTERLSLSKDTELEEDMITKVSSSSHVDPYMGLSGVFISALNSVAQILMLDFTKGFEMGAILRTIMHALPIIDTNPRDLLPHTSPPGMSSETLTHLGHIASGYRHALIVFLHMILSKLIRLSESDARVLQFTMIRSLLPCTKEEAITRCLEEVLLVPNNSPAIVGSCPLVFIVASETKEQSQFNIAVQLLTRLWTRTCLGNTGVALDFLREIQEAKFPDWRQELRSRRWDLIVS